VVVDIMYTAFWVYFDEVRGTTCDKKCHYA